MSLIKAGKSKMFFRAQFVHCSAHAAGSSRQNGERHDIPLIVMQYFLDQRTLREPQVIGIRGWNHIARDIVNAIEAENISFQVHQVAIAESLFPQSTRDEEHVDMLFSRKRIFPAMHEISVSQDLRIEAFAVVSDDVAESMAVVRQCCKKCRLL